VAKVGGQLRSQAIDQKRKNMGSLQIE